MSEWKAWPRVGGNSYESKGLEPHSLSAQQTSGCAVSCQQTSGGGRTARRQEGALRL